MIHKIKNLKFELARFKEHYKVFPNAYTLYNIKLIRKELDQLNKMYCKKYKIPLSVYMSLVY
ncbi:hypothetical protein EBZ38_10115 [bacterium]|nr:hypothetical protein [bacterium]NDD84608.1 hypothetical protein [bacterium]